MKKLLHTWWPALLLLIATLTIGIEIYQDYGIGIDEPIQREIGLKTYEYTTGQYPDYENYIEKDHGSGFELPLIYLERLLDITEYRDIYLMRHLATYILFVIGMLSGYVVVYKIFGNRLLATLAYIALVFHPRLFAHSFFNSKDIPAAVTYLLSITAAHMAFTTKKPFYYLLLGIACGYSTSIRLMNIIIIAPLAFFFLVDIIRSVKEKKKWLHILKPSFLVLAGFCITLYICWPTLWENPVNGLIDSYYSLAEFRWDSDVLFEGFMMRSSNLPWSYIPTWFFITIPELWLTLGTVGLVLITAGIIEKGNINLPAPKYRTILLAYSSFLLPLVLILVLKPVLYDEWRHLFFIYPAFIIIVIFALNELLQRRNKILLWGLCLAQLVLIGRFMIDNHPFQNVYFNSFVSHDENYLVGHYELDYWGTSNKHALEWLAEHTTQDTIRINRDKWQWSVMFTLPFLPDITKDRFVTADDIEDVDYYIQFFRTYPYTMPNGKFPNATIVHEEKVLGSPIYRIVKLR